ncbi:hypothetical protein ACPA9J_26705 [Pseudomonas aeruginosa]
MVHHEIQDAESAISQLADKDMSFALDSKHKIQGMLDDLEAMNRHTLKVIHELDRLSLEVGQGVDLRRSPPCNSRTWAASCSARCASTMRVLAPSPSASARWRRDRARNGPNGSHGRSRNCAGPCPAR